MSYYRSKYLKTFFNTYCYVIDTTNTQTEKIPGKASVIYNTLKIDNV